MSKVVAALVLAAAVACLFPAAAVGGDEPQYVVQGRVFCDTCKLGYETSASTYIAGAKVVVECQTKDTGAKTCSFPGVTDETGTYNIPVTGEHESEVCQVLLVSSPQKGCWKAVLDRATAPVFLTSNNGIDSKFRYANALGCEGDSILAVCAEILKRYALYDD